MACPTNPLLSGWWMMEHPGVLMGLVGISTAMILAIWFHGKWQAHHHASRYTFDEQDHIQRTPPAPEHDRDDDA